MGKVTGIGGVFFLATENETELTLWYQRCLGLQIEEFGGSILNWENDQAEDNGITVWHIGNKQSEWFSPSKARFMINYRVDDMEEILAVLVSENANIVKGPESHENGKFLWVLDPEGNKLELWEPKIWDESNKSIDRP